jgi:hypothetical protein
MKWTFVWDDDDVPPPILPVRCLDGELTPVVVIAGEAEERRRQARLRRNESQRNKRRNKAKQDHAKRLATARMDHVNPEKP